LATLVIIRPSRPMFVVSIADPFSRRQQRKDGALRKIGVPEKATRLADDGAELELDRLEVRVDPSKAGGLHRPEQSIAWRACLASGHDGVFGIARLHRSRT
jgi:hypothetical protein